MALPNDRRQRRSPRRWNEPVPWRAGNMYQLSDGRVGTLYNTSNSVPSLGQALRGVFNVSGRRGTYAPPPTNALNAGVASEVFNTVENQYSAQREKRNKARRSAALQTARGTRDRRMLRGARSNRVN